MHIICLVSILGVWVLQNRRSFFSRAGLVFLLGFLCGFSPWFLTQMSAHGNHLFTFNKHSLFDIATIKEMLSSALSPSQSWNYLMLLKNKFFGFPRMFARAPSLNRIIQQLPFHLFCATVVISILGILTLLTRFFHCRLRKKKCAPLPNGYPGGVFPCLLLLSYVLLYWGAFIGFCRTTEKFSVLYLVGLYPFVTLVQAIALQKIWHLSFRAGKAGIYLRTLIGAATIAYLFLSIANFRTLVAPVQAHALDTLLRQRGYSMRMLDVLHYNCTKNQFIQDAHFARVLLSTAGEPPIITTRYNFDFCVSAGLPYQRRLENQIYIARCYPASLQPLACHWIGISMGDRFGRDIKLCRTIIEKNVPLEFRHFVYEGLAFSVAAICALEPSFAAGDWSVLFHNIPEEYRHYFYDYAGFFSNRYAKNSGKLTNLFPAVNRTRHAREIDLRHYRTGIVNELGDESIIEAIRSERADYHLFMPEIYRQAGGLYYDAPQTIWTEPQLYLYAWQGAAEAVVRESYTGLSNRHLNSFKVPTASIHAAVQEALSDFMRVAHQMTPEQKNAVYFGIGRAVSLLTFGLLKDYGFSHAGIIAAQREAFYLGFGEGLRWRYGSDERQIRQIIRTQTPAPWHTQISRGASVALPQAAAPQRTTALEHSPLDCVNNSTTQ